MSVHRFYRFAMPGKVLLAFSVDGN